MRTRLSNGYDAEIIAEGAQLDLFSSEGDFEFTATPPEFSVFVVLAEHATKGMCPIISFAPGHQQNGWMDWFCEIDVQSQSVNLLNPWR
jgi:hypothetical protein